MAIRSASELGSALAGRLAAIVQAARTDLAPTTDESVEAELSSLSDRLCMSLTFSRPIGLESWARATAERRGKIEATAIVGAVVRAILNLSSSYQVESRQLVAALEPFIAVIDAAMHPNRHLETRDDHGAAAAVVDALVSVVQERDALTGCHSRATAEWARRLCTVLGLSPETTEFVERCAILHDLGKIATPDDILQKPAELSSSEWSVMRDHSAAGQRILERIPSLHRCAIVVRAHHESFDGTGYPDGLRGVNIPLEARIIAVADAFHAMISERPHRRAMAPRTALEIIAAGAGKQWDPDVCAALASMLIHADETPADVRPVTISYA